MRQSRNGYDDICNELVLFFCPPKRVFMMCRRRSSYPAEDSSQCLQCWEAYSGIMHSYCARRLNLMAEKGLLVCDTCRPEPTPPPSPDE